MFSKSSKGSNGDSSSIQDANVSPSIISIDLRIVGDLNSEGEIHIDGVVEGDIRCKVLLVGETASTKGAIIADTVRVHGTVTGQIKAITVSLAKSARVDGDILHENLAIEKGAFLEGHCKRLTERKELTEGKINLLAKDTGTPALATEKGEEPRSVVDTKVSEAAEA